MIEGAVKDKQTATAKGVIYRNPLHGSEIKEVTNLITANGMTAELFRSDWNLIRENVEHIIHVVMRPGAISAWHMHEKRNDCIFVMETTIRIVLYDGRRDSPTYEKVSVILSSRMRPATVTIPAGVWHGFENLEQSSSGFLNFATRMYDYQNPDEWRLPPDTTEIP